MPRSMDRQTKDSNCGSPVSSSSADIPDSSNAVAPGNASSIQRPPLLNISVPRLRDIKPSYKKLESIERPIDIVQLTVKDVEFLNCYAHLTNVCYSYFPSLGKVYFGEIASEDGSKVKVALLRCGESAATARGALNVTSNAIVSLAPKAVICTGFCGGINPDRAKLGDVVISTRLSTYNNDITTDVPKHMGDLIFTAADGWDPPLEDPDIYEVEVHRDRAVLSGPELVNDKARRKQLLEKYPMAVAIEMEGEGVYAAGYNLEVEWVVIKGISDYADGTKNDTEEWKNFACAMSASVVHNILKQPEALKGFTNYEKSSDRL